MKNITIFLFCASGALSAALAAPSTAAPTRTGPAQVLKTLKSSKHRAVPALGLDLGQLIDAVEKSVIEIKAALANATSSLGTILEGHLTELEKIEGILNKGIASAENEIVRFIVVAAFLDLEQLGALLEKTMLSIIKIVTGFEIEIRKIVLESLYVLLPDLIGVATKLGSSILEALRPVCEILTPLMPGTDKMAIRLVSSGFEERSQLIGATTSSALDNLITMIRLVTGLNIPAMVSQVPVTIAGMNGALTRFVAATMNLVSENKIDLDKIQELLTEAIISSEREMIQFLVLAPFLNLQQLQSFLKETAVLLQGISSTAVLKIQEVLLASPASDISDKFLVICNNLNADIQNAVQPLLKLMKSLLVNAKSPTPRLLSLI